MATPATHTEPTTPAPGPELTLGGPARIGTLSPETIARLNAVAAGMPAPAPVDDPTPPAPTPPPTPAPAKPPTPPVPKPSSSSATPKEPAAAPVPKPAPPEPAKPVADDKPAKETPAQLRAAYERAQARVAELESSYTATTKEKADAFTKLATLETQVKGYEERIAKEYEPLKQVLTEREQRLQAAEDKLRMTDFTKTEQWHNEHVKPIVDLNSKVERFLADVGFVTVNGQDLPANATHFNAILSAPSGQEAMSRAKAIFGPDFAAQVVSYRSELLALQSRQQKALETAHADSLKWQQQQEQQRRENQTRFKTEVAKRVALHLPKPAEGDAEEAAAIADGTQLAELIEHGDPRLTVEDVFEKVALAQARLRGEPLKELRLKRQAARIQELETQLAAYQTSEPPVETRRAGAPPKSEDGEGDWKQKILNKAVAAARST